MDGSVENGDTGASNMPAGFYHFLDGLMETLISACRWDPMLDRCARTRKTRISAMILQICKPKLANKLEDRISRSRANVVLFPCESVSSCAFEKCRADQVAERGLGNLRH
jgi:hypothetical protein